MSVLLLAASVVKAAAQIVLAGCCMGLGFWIAKKITTHVDEWVVEWWPGSVAALAHEHVAGFQ